MKYLKTFKETFFGNVFLIKTSKQTGPKNQSSAWRKGSRTCKPTEAKSTWRQEKQWNSLWWKLGTCGSSPLPPGSIQKMLKLQWHGCTGMIVSQPGVSPQHTQPANVEVDLHHRPTTQRLRPKVPVATPVVSWCFYCRWFLFDLYPLQISPRLLPFFNGLYKQQSDG